MYGEMTITTVDPESALLELCPKCNAQAGHKCTSDTGNHVATHRARLDLRKEREGRIYEPKTWRKIQHRRKMHAIKRAKIGAKAASGDYYIYGTGGHAKAIQRKEKVNT